MTEKVYFIHDGGVDDLASILRKQQNQSRQYLLAQWVIWELSSNATQVCQRRLTVWWWWPVRLALETSLNLSKTVLPNGTSSGIHKPLRLSLIQTLRFKWSGWRKPTKYRWRQLTKTWRQECIHIALRWWIRNQRRIGYLQVILRFQLWPKEPLHCVVLRIPFRPGFGS